MRVECSVWLINCLVRSGQYNWCCHTEWITVRVSHDICCKKKKRRRSFKCNRIHFWRWIRQYAQVDFSSFFLINPPTSIPFDNGGVIYERGPTACVIDNCCTVAACLPSPPWPANSSSITGRSGWWLMSAPVSDRARLCAFCCSQTAWYCSQIWLISVVTVQLLNLASKKGKMLFEKPYPTDCFQRSLKVLPPCDAVSVFFPCHIKKVQYAIISSEETTILMWCQRQLQYILCWRDVYWS